MQRSFDLSLTSLRSTLFHDNNVVEIAARVVQEFRAEQQDHGGSEFSNGDDAFSGMENDETREAGSKDGVKVEEEEKSSDVEEDFEFSFAPTEMAFSPISADEVFCNGQIRAIFPVRRRNLSIGEPEFLKRNSNSARLPLRKLLSEGRETPLSETEKLDSDPTAEETYCVWEPKLGDDRVCPGPGRCTKSSSCSSKWWKHLASFQTQVALRVYLA